MKLVILLSVFCLLNVSWSLAQACPPDAACDPIFPVIKPDPVVKPVPIDSTSRACSIFMSPLAEVQCVEKGRPARIIRACISMFGDGLAGFECLDYADSVDEIKSCRNLYGGGLGGFNCLEIELPRFDKSMTCTLTITSKLKFEFFKKYPDHSTTVLLYDNAELEIIEAGILNYQGDRINGKKIKVIKNIGYLPGLNELAAKPGDVLFSSDDQLEQCK